MAGYAPGPVTSEGTLQAGAMTDLGWDLGSNAQVMLHFGQAVAVDSF